MANSPQPVSHEPLVAFGGRWQRRLVGQGRLEVAGSRLRFAVGTSSGRRYSNAQIDDYQGLPRRHFAWQPPLRLTVQARFSHPAVGPGPTLRGTAGFGFWNDPFLMTRARLPTLPRAVWFFYSSPPSDIKLDPSTPGCGWKAATLDALRPIALPLALTALPAIALMNVPSVYRQLWPPIQRALQIREARLEVDMTTWHTYYLDWTAEGARFAVDDPSRPLLQAPSPRGPLGFVLWLDNQYLVATPWGRFRWGLLDMDAEQWLEVDHLSIEPLAGKQAGLASP
jgi:hypothetical protein